MSNRNAVQPCASEEHRHARVLAFTVNNVKTHTVKELCWCVPARGAYSARQRWAAMHGAQISSVTEPLEGQAERGKEHLKRHILLWRPEKPSLTQPALVWITLFIPVLLVLFFKSSGLRKKGIIPKPTAFLSYFKSSFWGWDHSAMSEGACDVD